MDKSHAAVFAKIIHAMEGVSVTEILWNSDFTTVRLRVEKEGLSSFQAFVGDFLGWCEARGISPFVGQQYRLASSGMLTRSWVILLSTALSVDDGLFLSLRKKVQKYFSEANATENRVIHVELPISVSDSSFKFGGKGGIHTKV